MGNFLDKTGLGTLWSKIKSTFATKSEVEALNGDNIIIGGGSDISIKEAVDSKLDNGVASNTYETKANAITGLSVSGKTITYTKGNGTTGTITTQDTDTHRSINVNGATVSGLNGTKSAVNFKAGSNVTITGSGTDITIAATNTTYSVVSASSTGTSSGLVTQKEKYAWNNKIDQSDLEDTLEDTLKDYPTTQSMVSTVTQAFADFDEYVQDTFAYKSDITTVMRYKGTVASVSALPTTENVLGDVWNVSSSGANYAWNGEQWDELSGVTDLSGYVEKANAITGLSVSGKTITYTRGDGTTGTITTQDTNTTYSALTTDEINAVLV